MPKGKAIRPILILSTAVFFFGLTAYAQERVWLGGIVLNTLIFVFLLSLYFYHTSRHRKDKAEAAEKLRGLESIAEIRMKTVEALAAAIDAKDQTPRGHIRRTQLYAVELGKLLDLGAQELAALSAGALLHDVGKLAIPAHILNKPDRLTAAEFERMKTHTTVGAAILESVEFPYPLKEIVSSHHEKWDGSGYPKGLKGEQIPLVARIISVVDFYDLTRCDRLYRPGLKRHESLALLKKKAGSYFDPSVVETFIQHVDEFDKLLNLADLKEQVAEDGDTELIESNLRQELSSDDQHENVAARGWLSVSDAQREVLTWHEIAHTVGSSLNLEDTFELISGKLRAMIDFDTCVIHLVDEMDGDASPAHVVGADKDYFSRRSIQIGVGITGWVIANARAMRSDAPKLDLTDAPDSVAERIRGVISVPLIREEMAFGAISLYSSNQAFYTSEHLRLLEAVALFASNAISNSLASVRTRESALADPLTGLPNARALRLMLEQRLAECQRQQDATLAALRMDLDDFEKINDAHGHGIGDRLIAEVAGVIKAQLRQMDMLARLEGDEFVAVMPTASADAAASVSERIRAAVETHRFTAPVGQAVRVGISIGVACFPSHGETADQILAAAHHDLRRNKHARKFKPQASAAGEVILLDSYR